MGAGVGSGCQVGWAQVNVFRAEFFGSLNRLYGDASLGNCELSDFVQPIFRIKLAQASPRPV